MSKCTWWRVIILLVSAGAVQPAGFQPGAGTRTAMEPIIIEMK
jgi:hypothetical protein